MITRRCARLAGLAGALVCAGTGVALAASPAHAAGGLEISINGAAYSSTASQALLNVSNLVPGSTATGILGVWNTTGNPSSITLQIVNPVAKPGGAGHLPAILVFTISASTDNGATYSVVWTGSASDLETGVQAIAALAGNNKELLEVSALLPRTAGNQSQGDSFTFGLTVTLAGPGNGGPIIPPVPTSPTPTTSPTPSGGPSGTSTSPQPTPSTSVAVLGFSTSAPPSSGGSSVTIPPAASGVAAVGGNGLPYTGFDVVLATMTGVLLILCGALLRMRWRTARRH